jgi:hypothetical protein
MYRRVHPLFRYRYPLGPGEVETRLSPTLQVASAPEGVMNVRPSVACALFRTCTVERGFAWASTFRRLVKDYERLPEKLAERGPKWPTPRSLARFNRRFTNRLALKIAGYLPGFAIVSHVGRKSGCAHRTPVNAFRTDGGYVVALTYGSESDWVKNVLGVRSCELRTRGRQVHLFDPCINTD